MITTRIHIKSKKFGEINLPAYETKYESIHHAIGELLEEGWASVTFQCDNVAILSDCAGDRLIIEVAR